MEAQLPSNNRLLASGGDSSAILIHDARSSKVLHRLEGHERQVLYVRFSKDDKHLVSASRDSTVRVWELEEGRQTAECKGHEGFVLTAHFLSGNRILSTGSDSTVRIWDRETCFEVAVLKGHNNRGILASDVDPIANILATGGTDNTIVLWDLSSYSKIATLATLDDWVSDLQFFDGGSKLLSSGRDGKVLLFDVAKKQLIKMVAKLEKWVNSARVSPDGKYLLTASDDFTFKLWDMNSGQLLRILRSSLEANTMGFFGNSHFFFYVDDHTIKVDRIVGRELKQKFLLSHLKALEKNAGARLDRTKLVSVTGDAAPK